MFILVAAGRRRVDGQATLKAVLVVGAKNNLANQTFMSYDMTLIDYMKDRIPKNVCTLEVTQYSTKNPEKSAIILVLDEKS